MLRFVLSGGVSVMVLFDVRMGVICGVYVGVVYFLGVA